MQMAFFMCYNSTKNPAFVVTLLDKQAQKVFGIICTHLFGLSSVVIRSGTLAYSAIHAGG